MRRIGVFGAALLIVVTSSYAVTHRGPEAKASHPAPRSYDLVIGPSDPDTVVTFAVTLRLRTDRLDRYLADVHDPSSPRYRRFVSPSGFGRRFGLPIGRIRRVRRDLIDAGFRVGTIGRGRTGLDATGTLGQISRYLHVPFVDVVDPAGRRYHAPQRRVEVPSQLSPAVTSIDGLNSRPVVPLRVQPQAESGVESFRLGPAEIAQAFEITPLWAQGVRGQGQSVAIWSPWPFSPSDVQQFDEDMGITGAPAVQNVFLGQEFSALQDDKYRAVRGEINLDIDTVRSVAPGAQILNYIPSLEGMDAFGEVAKAIADKGETKILSISYGPCDDPTVKNEDGTLALPPDERAYDEQQFKYASGVGVNVFAASGDTGAYECQRSDPAYVSPSTGYPDSPFIVTVGGTRLTLDTNGNYLREAGWEQIVGQLGGGGGLDPQDARPSWQSGPGVDNGDSNGNRQVPDVAAPADPYVGFYMVTDGKTETGSGTSQATPFWAGVTALTQQYAGAHGVKNGLGFLPETLYPLAATAQPFPPFHDVVVGGNRLYNCTPGWDYATGLGSPRVFNLARDITLRLQ